MAGINKRPSLATPGRTSPAVSRMRENRLHIGVDRKKGRSSGADTRTMSTPD
jgi:hypothetical protein